MNGNLPAQAGRTETIINANNNFYIEDFKTFPFFLQSFFSSALKIQKNKLSFFSIYFLGSNYVYDDDECKALYQTFVCISFSFFFNCIFPFFSLFLYVFLFLFPLFFFLVLLVSEIRSETRKRNDISTKNTQTI